MQNIQTLRPEENKRIENDKIDLKYVYFRSDFIATTSKPKNWKLQYCNVRRNGNISDTVWIKHPSPPQSTLINMKHLFVIVYFREPKPECRRKLSVIPIYTCWSKHGAFSEDKLFEVLIANSGSIFNEASPQTSLATQLCQRGRMETFFDGKLHARRSGWHILAV